MDHEYRVEFLSTSRIGNKRANPIDGVETAKDLEALINYYHNQQYELIETKTITSHEEGIRVIPTTDGILAIFRKSAT